MTSDRQYMTSTYPIRFRLRDASGAAVTGATVTAQVAKSSATTFAACSGTITELGNGVYQLNGHATDRNAIGESWYRFTATGAKTADFPITIVPWDPFDAARLGLTSLPAAAPGAANGLVTSGTAAGQISLSGGAANANATKWAGTVIVAGSLPVTRKAGNSEGLPVLHRTGYTSVAADAAIGATAVVIDSASAPPIRPGMSLQFEGDGDQGDAAYVIRSYADNGDGTGTITLVDPLRTAGVTFEATPAVVERGMMDAASQSSVDALPDAETIAAAVENALLDDDDTRAVQQALVDKIAAANPDLNGLTLAAIAQTVWEFLTADATTAGSLGKLIKDNLDAKVSLAATETNATSNAAALATALTDLGTPLQDGAKVDIVDAPNATAVAAIKAGLSTVTTADVRTQADAALAAVGLTTTVTERIDAAISSVSGGVGGTLIITPIQANSANPRYSTRLLAPVAKGSVPTDILTVTDGTGAAVDLSGKSLRMTFATPVYAEGADPDEDDPVSYTGVTQYVTTGNGLTVGGASNNQVTIQHAATLTANAGDYFYWLWDVTGGEDAKILLVKGTVEVEDAVELVA